MSKMVVEFCLTLGRNLRDIVVDQIQKNHGLGPAQITKMKGFFYEMYSTAKDKKIIEILRAKLWGRRPLYLKKDHAWLLRDRRRGGAEEIKPENLLSLAVNLSFLHLPPNRRGSR